MLTSAKWKPLRIRLYKRIMMIKWFKVWWMVRVVSWNQDKSTITVKISFWVIIQVTDKNSGDTTRGYFNRRPTLPPRAIIGSSTPKINIDIYVQTVLVKYEFFIQWRNLWVDSILHRMLYHYVRLTLSALIN